jgi:peptidoglycan/LPS O-acetylase OafA/YrhL
MTSRDESARLVALDGLRAVAVALVVASHSFTLDLGLGGYGVRLFFVLSGFLITGILLRARDKAAQQQQSMWQVCTAFYARRTLRIFPLAYLAMAVAWVIGLPAMRSDALWYLGYAQNVLMAVRNSYDGGLPHFWSLAVEEQFYLFWPFVLLWCPRRALMPTFVSLVLLAGAARWLLVWYDQALAAYVLMPSRLDALAGGGLLALLVYEQRRVTVSTLLGSALVLGLTSSIPALSPVAFEWACILVSAALVLWLTETPDHLTTRLFSTRWMVYLGTISYGIYVWHVIIPLVVRWLETRFDIWLRFPHDPGWLRFVTIGVCSVAVSMVSWHLIERPLSDLKRRFPYVLPGAKRAPAAAP